MDYVVHIKANTGTTGDSLPLGLCLLNIPSIAWKSQAQGPNTHPCCDITNYMIATAENRTHVLSTSKCSP